MVSFFMMRQRVGMRPQSRVRVSSPPRRISGRSTLLGLLGAVVLATPLLLGQQPGGDETAAPQPTFSTAVKVVNVLATVRDGDGQIVRDLSKDDFILEEDGRPQTIRYFSQENNLPLTLGLLVDTSASQREVIDEERIASYTFLDQVLRENDAAFVMQFAGEAELLQDITSSRRDLESALAALRIADPRQTQQWPSPGPWPASRRGPGANGGTALYDAVFLASDELMRQQPNRKALIILSDGVDNASKMALAGAIEAAQRADTLVYCILFVDERLYQSPPDWGGPRRRRGIGGWPGGWPGGIGGGRGGGPGFPLHMYPDGRRILERISKETGARLFEVSRKQSVSQIYASIEEELRNQYSLGYTPNRADASPGYRKIKLSTRKRDIIVQTRDGYYAEP